jgi:hypothetical protein
MDVTKPYSKILAFVNELNRNFGDKHKNLGLYYVFLKEKTPLSNKKALAKQNNVFLKFLENNREAVLNMDLKLLRDENISFSEKVYINIKQLLTENKDAREVIFKHLQLISALLITDDKMVDALKEDKENKFLDKYVSKIDDLFKNTNGVEDPMAAAMSLLQSGALSDMTKELKNGNLNVGKLISSLQEKMKTTASEISASTPAETTVLPDLVNNLIKDPASLLSGGGGDIMGMVTGLIGNMDEDAKVNMMNMVGGLMNGNGGGDIMGMVSGLMSGNGGGDMMGMVSGLMGNMDEDAKVNMMNMVGGLMNGNGGGDIMGMVTGLMGNMDEDAKVNMMNMVGGLMSGGGGETGLADMIAGMTLQPQIEEVEESTTEETPQ